MHMHTLFYPDMKQAPSGRFAATIGFFDGVHLGHHHVISQLQQLAHQHGLCTMAITFDTHPRQVIQPEWNPQLLTSLEEKADLLQQTGIDQLVVLRFDKTMAQLSAHDFMQQVLQQQLHVDLLLTGYDNRFGHDRTEGFEQYAAYGQELGMQVCLGTPFELQGHRVCSSLIRQLLQDGQLNEANACLGRPYHISGVVEHGYQIGRTLGFPTANLQLSSSVMLIPATGVYAVRLRLQQEKEWRQGVMNIGTRPTFEGSKLTVEVNIFDFIGNLYDQQLEVELIARLRGERHFDTPEALAHQMECDVQEAKSLLVSNKQQSQTIQNNHK